MGGNELFGKSYSKGFTDLNPGESIFDITCMEFKMMIMVMLHRQHHPSHNAKDNSARAKALL